MNNHKRTAAVAAVTAIATAIAIPSLTGAKPPSGTRASSAHSQTLRLFDKPVATTLTNASGKVISRPPYPQPQAGDVLDVYSLDYLGNHRHHAAHWSMSSHLRCTFGTGPPACESHTAIGGSLLIFNGNKLVGGTGRYRGATGRILSNKQLPGAANTSDIVARVHRR